MVKISIESDSAREAAALLIALVGDSGGSGLNRAVQTVFDEFTTEQTATHGTCGDGSCQ